MPWLQSGKKKIAVGLIFILSCPCLIWLSQYDTSGYVYGSAMRLGTDNGSDIRSISDTRSDVTRTDTGSDIRSTSDKRGVGFKIENIEETCRDLDILQLRKDITSNNYSKVLNVALDENTGIVRMDIITYTRRNTHKSLGGDLILIWAVQVGQGGSVAGHVVDHGNGSFTGTVQLFWTGKTRIHVKLAAALVNTCLRFRAIQTYGNSVFSMDSGWGIRGHFRTNTLTENTPCQGNAYIYGYQKVCNFTKLNDNLTWYCGQPKQSKFLQCRHIYAFKTGPFDTTVAKPAERAIRPLAQTFTATAAVYSNTNVAKKPHMICNTEAPIATWGEHVPSGYWDNKQWRFTKCISNLTHTIDAYRKCLSHKSLYFYGDSTIRQYAEYFIKSLLNNNIQLKYKSTTKRQYRNENIYSKYNITVTFKGHAMPFHNPDLSPNGITSMATELELLADSNIEDSTSYLILNYHTHFMAYPVSVFRQRIRSLALAIKTLLERKPNMNIFYKGPHFCQDEVRWFDNTISLLYFDIIKHEFSKLSLLNKVRLLDTWSITVAHDNKDLHPLGDALTAHIQQLMSYVC